MQKLVQKHGQPFSDRVERAMTLAYSAHQNQFRSARTGKTRIPYIAHPVGTALKVLEHYPDIPKLPDSLETLVCIALLHDVLEDTTIEPREIESIAGETALTYVEALSKPSAGVAGKPRIERNRVFFDQIVAAGPTAIFVKLCDSMHNLSRPSSMPNDLLKKTVEKCETSYVRLLDAHEFPPSFVDEYHELISGALRCLQSSHDEKTLVKTLVEAIASASVLGHEKVLELHDVAEYVESQMGASHCIVWRSVDRDGVSQIQQVTGKTASIPPAKLIDNLAASGENEDRVVEQILASMSLAETFDAYFIKEQVLPNEHVIFCVLFHDEVKPDWCNDIAISGIIRLLLQRLILAHVHERARLATESANIGLKLDVSLAQSLRATTFELRSLVAWLQRCREALDKVEYFLRSVILRSRTLTQSIVNVEGRVKDADSILNKFLRQPDRTWPIFEQMEDIAGARVVCVTQDSAYEVLARLSSSHALSMGIAASGIVPNPVRDYVQEPTNDGYRGVHLIVDVDTYGTDNAKLPVPCEIQIRTLCQDNWAKISHIASYRRSRNGKRLASVKTMAKMLNECQELVDELFESESASDE